MKSGDLIATRYRLLRPIGGGAMGTVWAARHELLGRDFALKFARIPKKADPTARTLFQREAQLVGKLRHPNIVDVTDFGEVSPDGDFFLAMELLEGESLAEHITRHGSLDSYEAVSIAEYIARGLAAVHAVGIVHRDVKPENIYLARNATGDVVPKLLDFGISKEWSDSLTTQQGALTGTPAYMSPEQANGETRLDPRTDIWSLGVVLYEMLTGKHPFVEPNYQALMTAIADRPHTPLDATLPGPVCKIVDRCLAKRPDDRFSSGEELAEALRSLDAGGPTKRRIVASPGRRSYGVVGGSVFALLLLVIIAAVHLRMRTVTETQPVTMSSAVPEQLPAQSPSAHVVLPQAEATPSVSATSPGSSPANAPPPTPTRSTRPPQDKSTTTTVTTPGF